MKVGIIDTGACNLNSVYQALRRTGAADLVVSHVSAELSRCDRLILPGVGSAAAVMEGITRYDLRDFLLLTGRPLLGICLGMQIQALDSAEVPAGQSDAAASVPCMGLMTLHVERFPGEDLILPHMGWDQVHASACPLFSGIPQDSFFYFVHSYYVPLCQQTIATCTYGVTFSAATQNGNMYGVQFHPEKSGAAGQRLLDNFLRLSL